MSSPSFELDGTIVEPPASAERRVPVHEGEVILALLAALPQLPAFRGRLVRQGPETKQRAGVDGTIRSSQGGGLDFP